MRPFDLIYPLQGPNAGRLAQLPAPNGAHTEQWGIFPQYAGFYWTFRRWEFRAPRSPVTAQGYQEIDHWWLTHGAGPLTDLVTVRVEAQSGDWQIVLRGEILRALREQPMGAGAINDYDWRLTLSGGSWLVEMRRTHRGVWYALLPEPVLELNGDPLGRSTLFLDDVEDEPISLAE